MSQFGTLQKLTIDIPTGATFNIKQVAVTEGFDGHCLRAFAYFPEKLPGIVNTVDSINSIEYLFPAIRQDSKAPTFLLTYGGTYHGLMHNVGLPMEIAKTIEENYHTLYTVSDDWVREKVVGASKDGYVTVAFGMRVRTPLLAKTLLNTSSTPYEAQSEARTAGNALGQSWGMLTNRAGIEFQKRTWASKYIYDILPIAQIHDALYFLVRNNLGCVNWFNTNLIECMQWQQDPMIQHKTVKLGGNVEIYHPSWEHKFTIPNNASNAEIVKACA